MEALFMALMTALFISIRLMRPVAHDDRQEEHRPKKCAAGQLTVEHHRHKQRKMSTTGMVVSIFFSASSRMRI